MSSTRTPLPIRKSYSSWLEQVSPPLKITWAVPAASEGASESMGLAHRFEQVAANAQELASHHLARTRRPPPPGAELGDAAGA